MEIDLTEKYTLNYADVKRVKPPGFRGNIRDLTLTALSGIYKNTVGWESMLSKPRIQFIYIHHVFADEENGLRKLLAALSKYHNFISYTDAWERIVSGNIDKPYICFSTDDGLKNNLQAADILNEFGAKACFFICPSVIGEKDFGKIRDFSSSRIHFPPVEFLTWKDVEKLQSEGHEIGSHTFSHINVAKTEPGLIEKELNDSYQMITQYYGAVKHFAYPYGRYFHFSRVGRDLVFGAGYKSCASAERGCHIVEPGGIRDSRDLLIRRDHVILDWPLNHVLYFLARNSMNSNIKNNCFPFYEDRGIDK
jgi:peptidoglycan/xylan/chitin deacetylase (PgdA/CDA1 family)